MDVQLEKEVKDLIDGALARHCYDHHKNRCATLFRPPTCEEVAQYCREKGLEIDPSYFVSFYGSKGWKVGKVPMKDWRLACQNANRMGWCKPEPGKVHHEIIYKCFNCGCQRRESQMSPHPQFPSERVCKGGC